MNRFPLRGLCAVLLALVLLTGGSSEAQTGTPFVDSQSWYMDAFGLGVLPQGSNTSIQVETDGTPGLTAADHTHPYPAAMNAGLSAVRNLRLSPGRGWLLAYGAPANFEPGVRLYIYRIPATDGAPLEPVIEGTTMPGISFLGFFDQGAAAQQHLFFAVESPGFTEQRIMWVDMDAAVAGFTTALNPDVNDVKLAPNGIAAFVQTDGTFTGQGTYHLVELCVDDLGTNINPTGNPYQDLPSPTATAYLLQNGSSFEAQVWHGSTSFAPVPLDDCSGVTPPEVGACCESGNCYDNVTLEFCENQLGGTWQGSGTQCQDTNCPPPPAPSLSMVLTGPSQGQTGSPLGYTIGFSNSGDGDAYGVTATVGVPFGSTFVSASGGGTYNSSTRQIVWNVGTVAAGAGGSRSFEVQATCGTSSLGFTANLLDAANHGTVWGPSWTTFLSDPSTAAAHLTVQKVVPGGEPVRDGETVEFRFTLENTDPAARFLKFDCSVGQPLVLDAIVDAAGGSVTENGSRFWWEGGVPGMSSVTVVVRAIVPTCRTVGATTSWLNDNQPVSVRNRCFAVVGELAPVSTQVAEKDVRMHAEILDGQPVRTIGGWAWGMPEGARLVRPGDSVTARWSFANHGSADLEITSGTLSAAGWEVPNDPPFVGPPPPGSGWDSAQQQVTWSGTLAAGDSVSIELELVYPADATCSLNLSGTLATAGCGYLASARGEVIGVGQPFSQSHLVYLDAYGDFKRQRTTFDHLPEDWYCAFVEIFSSLTANADGSYWFAGLPTLRFDPVNLDVAYLGIMPGFTVDHINAVVEDGAAGIAYVAGIQYVEAQPRIRLYAVDMNAQTATLLWAEPSGTQAMGAVVQMERDAAGRLVFTTGTPALYRMDPNDPATLENLADNGALDFYRSLDLRTDGHLLVADGVGMVPDQVVNLASVDPADGTHTVLVDLGEVLSSDFSSISSVAEGDSGRYYVARSWNGVHRLDLSGPQPAVQGVPGSGNMSIAGLVFVPGVGGLSAVDEPEDGAVPTAFRFQGAAPNPFNPRTRLLFSLAEAGPVELVIYDVQGRRVKTLVDESLAAGPHEVMWDGVDQQGRSVASGLYLARLRGGSETRTAKLLLTR